MLVLGRVPWAIFLVFLPADWVHIAIVEFQWVQATFSESTRHVDNYELHTQDASEIRQILDTSLLASAKFLFKLPSSAIKDLG